MVKKKLKNKKQKKKQKTLEQFYAHKLIKNCWIMTLNVFNKL